MVNNEQTPSPQEPKIPFEPLEYGMEAELSEEDEALIAMSEGDLKLFLSEWTLSVAEKEYNRGEISPTALELIRDGCFMLIDERRHALGLPPRPNYPSS